MDASDVAAKLTSASIARRQAREVLVDYSTTHTRAPTKKTQRAKLTPAEKALRAVKRDEQREVYEGTLKANRELITERAELMKAQFGRHSIEYYEQEIVQKSRAVTKPRKVNKYNAFVRKKLRELNEGESSFSW